ncbi:MAG: hypothetical protein EOP45_19165 [Sphingobacteriaceae bacterium]|nr:MAG: hypothetical protein EOP45_19165 [Sphingobacteriaceae bacterium]
MSIYFKKHNILAVIVLSWEKEIINLNGENIRGLLKKPSQDYYRELDFFNNKELHSIPIFCFDHDLSKRGKSRVFYDMNNRLMTESNMDFTLHPAFEKLASRFNKMVFKASVKNELSTFYGIIHELFSNTHEHARTNEKGYNLYPNIRALYIKFHNTTIPKYQETYQEFPGLVQFFKSDFKVNDNKQLYLVELSVLDSGPGLYKRYTGTPNYTDPIKEEVDIIKQCMYIHNTSSTELNKSNKGFGLDRMLQLINGKGFVRIKTGRADVFRDMKNHRYVAHENHSAIQLNDWRNNSATEFTVNEPTAGTLISIFYPLEYVPYE